MFLLGWCLCRWGRRLIPLAMWRKRGRGERYSEPVYELREDGFFPMGIVIGQDMCPCCPYELEIECQIVYGGYLHGKEFFGLEEMVYVRTGVYVVYAACPLSVER